MYYIKVYRTKTRKCAKCKGTGRIPHERYRGIGYMCPVCKGKGIEEEEVEHKLPISLEKLME